jgi:hypothetical protein
MVNLIKLIHGWADGLWEVDAINDISGVQFYFSVIVDGKKYMISVSEYQE